MNSGFYDYLPSPAKASFAVQQAILVLDFKNEAENETERFGRALQ